MKISHSKTIISTTFHCFFVASILLISVETSAQSSSVKISECFIKNDFTRLSSFFEEKVDLEIKKKEESLSKVAAEKKIIHFFSNKPVENFQLIHEGSSNSSLKYFIGSFSLPKENYRTYVLFREDSGKVYISELKIEAEE